jgi:hypothetical protein
MPSRSRASTTRPAVEALDAVRAPLGVSFEDDFGIPLREKTMAFGGQLVAQLPVIVDAAVEDDGQAELRIDHRLLRCGSEIDNAQPPMAERDAVLHERTAGIGAARPHAPDHRRNTGAGSAAIEGQLTANTAHLVCPGT